KGNPRPPHLNGSQLSFARPSALAMADEASNQRRKRCLADESADQSPTSLCQEVRTRNRPERDQRMSPKKVAEIVETLVEALNKRKRQRLNKVGSSRSPEWYKAALLGYGAATKLLVDRGAVLHAVDNDGHTAHDLAEERGQERAIKALDGEEPGFYIYEGRIIVL
ncbi:hypothetical protein V491_04698, partial [Pseudogymnoascus sp. VKM F-3775]